MAKYFVLVGFIQGVLLLLMDEALRKKWEFFSSPEFAYPAYALILIVPLVGLLSYQFTQRRLLVKALFAISVLLICLTGYSGYLALPISSQSFGHIFTVALAMWVLMYVGLPFLQSYFKSDEVRPSYKHLYEFGWLNTQVFVMALLFSGLVWALLGLWSALFELLHIKFFSVLFFDRFFAYPATGVMLTYGASLGLAKFNINNIKRTDFLFRAVTVLLTAMVVLFLLALFVSGLEPLWQTKNATFLLLWIQVFAIFFVNGMFQQGYQNRVEAGLTRWSVSLLLLALPIFSLVCLYAMYVRVEQYGWTVDRIWAVIAVVVLSIYAFGYAIAAARGLFHKGDWLAWVAPTNIIAALVVLMIIVMTHSPLLSPYHIAVESQVARLMNDEVKARGFDFRYLRFETGQVGLDKLQVLSRIQNHPEAVAIQQMAKKAIAMQSRWGANLGEVTLAQSKSVFTIYPGGHDVDESLYDYIYAQKEIYPYRGCFSGVDSCSILFIDLNEDGDDEAVLLSKDRPTKLLEKEKHHWREVAGFAWGSVDNLEVNKHLETGSFSVVEHQWKRLKIGNMIWKVM